MEGGGGGRKKRGKGGARQADSTASGIASQGEQQGQSGALQKKPEPTKAQPQKDQPRPQSSDQPPKKAWGCAGDASSSQSNVLPGQSGPKAPWGKKQNVEQVQPDVPQQAAQTEPKGPYTKKEIMESYQPVVTQQGDSRKQKKGGQKQKDPQASLPQQQGEGNNPPLEQKKVEAMPASGQPKKERPQKRGQKQEQTGKGAGDVGKVAEKVSTMSLTGSSSKAEKSKDVNESFNAIVARPDQKGGRRAGRPIAIETNYLALQIDKVRKDAYHYDVTITIHEKADKLPPKRFFHLAMIEYLRTYHPNCHPAFDGRKNLYSAIKLPEDHEGVVEVKEDAVAKELKLKVRIKLVNTIDMTQIAAYMSGKVAERPQMSIQCLDVVFGQNPSLYATRVGRSFFSKPGERETTRLGTGMELWHGLFQSACLGSKPFLNVDVAHKAFPIAQPVLNLVYQLMEENAGRNANPRDLERAMDEELSPVIRDQLDSFLRSLKVKYEIPRQPTSARNAKVNQLTKPANKLTFTDDKNKVCDVATYFKEQRKYQLKYPKMPCLHVGNPDRTVYIPLELCEICPGQVLNRKMNELQTAAMIKKSATPTWIRKQKILDAVNRVKMTDSPSLQEFGVKVSTNFTEVDARILDPPDLEYSNRQRQNPRFGVWRAGQFFSSKNLVTWTILNLDGRTRNENLSDFARMVQQSGRTLGMNIAQPKFPPTSLRFDFRFGSGAKDIKSYFDDMTIKGVELMFVVLPGMETTKSYALVKKIAELDVGILTQCIKSNTMSRMNPSTVSNILLKVNAKLNGTNHILAPPTPIILQTQACLVVGADVTHPPPDSRDKPSVAAVAASCDLTATKYHFLWRLQDPRTEMIADLKDIMVELIKYYKIQTGKPPQSILFFRDGVSEGQFAEVRRVEIQAIKDALYSLSPNYKPLITFLVVQKRHHTRFFPKNERDGDPKNGNVPPGTCVDSVITYPSKMDFYLCSHASLQGVSRPTRYCLLLNEHNFKEDEIETLTYYLCHLFQRCTRSVSYPAPTYYAHLAAFRAMHYFTGANQTITAMSDLNKIQERLVIKSNICNDRPMFFI